MMDQIKAQLIGQVIEDIGLINRNGEKHCRITLSGSSDPLVARFDDVMITLAGRKPMGRALTPYPAHGRVRVGG